MRVQSGEWGTAWVPDGECWGRDVGPEEGDDVSGLVGTPVAWLPEALCFDEKVWSS